LTLGDGFTRDGGLLVFLTLLEPQDRVLLVGDARQHIEMLAKLLRAERQEAMVDPIVRLALALHSNRGAYAALLGSGISAAAGVPTGWQIVSDLISKVAALEGAVVGEDPIAWYRSRFGEEPDYSKLLDELARSATERSLLLRKYFEPTDDERRRGKKVPSAAHRALAELAAQGYISVFLTSNFDRLLEQALEAAGALRIPKALVDPWTD
jgi:hypothetical protein